MSDGENAAILVWGDPTLYDSTIRNLEALAGSGGLEFEYEIIPGISSAQALAAKHKTTLNSLGRPVEITTGRRLLEQGLPEETDSVVVMLDARNAYKNFVDQNIHIYWGAYLGTPDEMLISGELREVADEIESARAQARRAHGWIMDIYLMRQSRNEG
jgi:precorrin-6A synthase